MEDKNCKIGVEVQTYDSEGEPRDGVIAEVHPPEKERPREYWNCSIEEQELFKMHLLVKYEDGSEEKVSTWDVDPRDSEIEREFRKAAPDVLEQIYKHVAEAHEALDKAVSLSEKHGIPFDSSISPLSQSYKPNSFGEKYEGVSDNIISAVTDCSAEYEGWQHSAVCY